MPATPVPRHDPVWDGLGNRVNGALVDHAASRWPQLAVGDRVDRADLGL